MAYDTPPRPDANNPTSSLDRPLVRRGSGDVDTAQIQQLFGGQSETRDLAGHGFSYRHDAGNWHGELIYTINWDFINTQTRVFISIAEGAPDGGKFIGSAPFLLYNVAPRHHAIDMWMYIGWDHPIRLYIDVLAIN